MKDSVIKGVRDTWKVLVSIQMRYRVKADSFRMRKLVLSEITWTRAINILSPILQMRVSKISNLLLKFTHKFQQFTLREDHLTVKNKIGLDIYKVFPI
jgi:hypothetical protein